jgi:microcin C transport system substrate-binding protein
MTFSPRALKSLSCAIASLIILAGSAGAAEKQYGMALIGTPKYGPDFKHFDYVNPDAPKGGFARLSAIGTFDNFNVLSYKANLVQGLGLVYEALMTSSLDESSTEYPLIAEWVTHPDDFSSVTFKLRDNARWHDGRPITPEDVIFSLDAFKKHHTFYAAYYHNVTKAEKTGEREVTFTFDEKNNRELPHIVGQLTILPKHFYEGRTDLDPGRTWMAGDLLGSGSYKMKSYEPGRFVVYERVKDYWGANLPVNVGQDNIDEIRYDYFQDTLPAFESFKAGRIDFVRENSAKQWATAYDFPALLAKKVIKRDDVVLKNPQPMQAFVMNIRRDKFKDARIRQAFNLMFNFEWMNKNIFYGQYKRTSSYFENTELAAQGLPQGKELEILETVRSEVPAEVFTTEYKNPVNDEQSLVDRNNRRKALELAKEAGWEIRGGTLVNSQTGAPMEVEIMIVSPAMERVASPYRQALELLGVKTTIRTVDAAQYKRRTDTFDYDIIVDVFGQSESPGNEQRDFWSSVAADKEGSRNSIGIKNPAVDKLIDRIIFAKDREELIAACHALDRVLLWNHYVVPQFYTPSERFAYWDRYSAPKTLPSRSIGFPTVWWYDAAKAEKLGTN